MDEQVQILLNGEKNVDSVNVDNYIKLNVENKTGEIIEYDIRNGLSATEIFDAEREANPIYRIYGRIEYLSLLNGLSNAYNSTGAFFLHSGGTNIKNIFNSFKFYLLKATTGYTNITGNTDYIINEQFLNWTTSSPSSYPIGWIVSVTTNSYIQKTLANQAQFVLDNQTVNLITLRKNLTTSVYGDFVITTNVGISPLVVGTDLLTISVFSNATLLFTFSTLAASAGFKQYTFTATSGLPVTHVIISANSKNKSIYLDYFRMYRSTIGTITIVDTVQYARYFEVIATPSDFELYNAGYTNNVYGDQVYAFNFNKDFDVTPYVDEFGFPIMELYLYPQYQVGGNGNSPQLTETMSGTSWGTNGVERKILFTSPLPSLSNSDRVYGDLIEYSQSMFLQTQISPQTYYISTPYKDGVTQKYFQWKYDPFIPLRLRYFYDSLNNANTGTTSYEQQISIPYYATPIGDGNYVWKDILPQGYIDPITNQGVDYPFINMKRYLFSTVILDIPPNLDDTNTFQVFSEIQFGPPTLLNNAPLGDIDDIGKPCL